VLVRVTADPETCVFAEDLEDALLDLALALSDRIARTHPGRLHGLALPDHVDLESWSLESALPVYTPSGRQERSLGVTCVVSRHKQHDRLWFPGWNLRHWLPAGSDVAKQGSAFLREYAKTLGSEAILERRVQRPETLHMLTLEVTPPSLAAFTGKYLGCAMLPEPTAEVEPPQTTRSARRRPTPMLDQIGIDLTHRAKRGELGRGFGFDELVDSLQTQLTRDGGALVLVGDPGVGKTSIVYELAHRWAPNAERGNSPALWFVDATRLIALHSPLTDWRHQTLAVVDECMTAGAVWFAGSALALLDAGKAFQSEQNVSQLLRPLLARRKLRFLAEATTQQWATLEVRDPGFARLFTPVRVAEPDEARSLRILQAAADLRVVTRLRAAPEDVRERARTFGQVARSTSWTVESDARQAARELGRRFGGHMSEHASSLALLLRTIDDAQTSALNPQALRRSAVVDTFCRESGMPPRLIRDDVPLQLEEVRSALQARILGQPRAIVRMVELVGLIKAGLTDPSRPLGSFLFIGPTGVGKTETAKALADYLYGSDQRLVRFDMSELVTADAVQRFVGMGGQPGKLVSEIRRLPFCVLLLDEIEKAHPIVFDALLAVLGEARLSDEAGRTATFRNVVIVMTSNLGVDTQRSGAGFGAEGSDAWAEHFVREARRFFRPEFFNRIDHVVPFEALPTAAIDGIAQLQIRRLATRTGLVGRGVSLNLDPVARAVLVAEGTDVRLGARPLKRAIERKLTAPMARWLANRNQRTPPGTVFASLDEHDAWVLHFEPARGAGHADEKALRACLGAITELRYFVDQCRESTVGRDLRREVHRIARLMAEPRYLRGHESMARQYAEAGQEQRLLEEFDALYQHVASLEDLAYESVARRSFEATDSLRSERDAALASLRDLGFRLGERGMATTKEAIVFIRMNPSARLFRKLLHTYFAIAKSLGWSVQGFESVDLPGDEAGSIVREFRKIAEFDPEDSIDSIVSTLIRRAEAPLALHVRGPHAALMLRGETGVHAVHEWGETVRVSIRVELAPGMIRERFDEVQWARFQDNWSSAACRTINTNQDIVIDHASRMRLPLEPRLERAYLRFIEARVFDEAWFPNAHRTLERWWGGAR